MIAATQISCERNAASGREVLMKRGFAGVFALLLALAATSVLAPSALAPSALAQDKPPLKLGGILDMSSLFADITGSGTETAARRAGEDSGGGVHAGKCEASTPDHP